VVHLFASELWASRAAGVVLVVWGTVEWIKDKIDSRASLKARQAAYESGADMMKFHEAYHNPQE
jgi:hypothetical protein